MKKLLLLASVVALLFAFTQKAGAGGTSGSFAFASPVGAPFTGSTGTYNVQVLNASGDVLGTDDITVSNSFFGFGYNYVRC